MKLCMFSLIFLAIQSCYLAAQSPNPFSLKQMPWSIALMDESLSVPNFWFLNYPLNPAIMIGTEYVINDHPRHDWVVAANLGGYYHKYSQTAIFLNSEVGFRYHLNRWNAQLRAGAGYAHTFYPGAEYRLIDGRPEKVNAAGAPTFMPSVSLGLGYRLSESEKAAEVSLLWMLAVDQPFSFYTGLHQLVGFRCTFYPFRSSNSYTILSS
ncbi:MAG: hypothetical protein AAF587_17895 [Bacteroidota bacterium]